MYDTQGIQQERRKLDFGGESQSRTQELEEGSGSAGGEAEEWRPVIGWEQLYEVSSFGRVRSLARPATSGNGLYSGTGRYARREKLRKPFVMKNGYAIITLCRDGKNRGFLVHRLVCAAWHGAPLPKQEANHINFQKLDNRPCNLEWTTPLQNTRHTVKHRLHAHGERHGAAKISSEDIPEMFRLRSEGLTYRLIGERFGVCAQQAHRIINNIEWKTT